MVRKLKTERRGKSGFDFIRSDLRLRLQMMLMVGAYAVSGVFLVITLVNLKQIILGLGQQGMVPESDSLYLDQGLDHLIWWISGIGLALLAFFFYLISRLSSQVFGPEVALRRKIKLLSSGDFSTKVSLRKGDFFTGLMADLHDLGQSLEKKSKINDRP